MRRLLLVRHAATEATRAVAFPADESLGELALVGAKRLRDTLPARCEAICSPALRCRQTAAAAGFEQPHVESALAECDFGSWAGRRLADVDADEPETVRAWMTDPDACPHGGESQTTFTARVGCWLDAQAGLDGRAVAFTHGGVVKAALVHALGAPPAAFWRIDVAPLAITELHAHDGRWTVTRVNWLAGGARGATDGASDAPTPAEATP